MMFISYVEHYTNGQPFLLTKNLNRVIENFLVSFILSALKSIERTSK